MTKRIIHKEAAVTKEQALGAVNEAALLQTRLRILQEKAAKRIQAIQSALADEQSALESRIDAAMATAHGYAAAHRDELFSGARKSAETALAEYGFRMGQPTLKPLPKHTWESALKAALESKTYASFVVSRPRLDKEALKKRLGKDALAALGLQVVQQEVFFVDPKVDAATKETIDADESPI